MTKIQGLDGEPLNGGVKIPESSGSVVASAIKQFELIDPDKIIPLEYRVLVKIVSVEEITDSGIFKPASVIEKELFGRTFATFIKAGSEAFTGAGGDYIDEIPTSGDKVMITKYAGNTYRDAENNLYRFANDKDIVAVIKEDQK